MALIALIRRIYLVAYGAVVNGYVTHADLLSYDEEEIGIECVVSTDNLEEPHLNDGQQLKFHHQQFKNEMRCVPVF